MSTLKQRAEAVASTPAARWRENGEPDPHAGGYYDGERATLALGHLTDDEIANGVYMNADQPLDTDKIMRQDPNYHAPIVWLSAAKERIRWLSRKLVDQQAEIERLSAVQAGAPMVSVTQAEHEAVTLGQMPEWESPLMPVHQMGAEFAVHQLAEMLDVKGWNADGGTESYEGDLKASLYSLLMHAAGKTYGDFSIVPGEAGADGSDAAADARRYRWLRSTHIAGDIRLAEHFGGTRLQNFDRLIDAAISKEAK